MSSTPARNIGWLATTPTGKPSSRARPIERILGEVCVDFEEAAAVEHAGDDLPHVVGLAGVFGHEPVERVVAAPRIVVRLYARRVLAVVLRQVGEDLLDQAERCDLVVGREMGDARQGVVRHRAAQRVEVHLLAGHRLDDVRPGDEHVAGLAHHDDEVGEGRGVDRAARARAPSAR